VSSAAQFLNPSDAAQQLGVSAKALRVYEHRGLITPARTLAGWRAYGPAEMARAREIVELRTLGLALKSRIDTSLTMLVNDGGIESRATSRG
jgi:DNA-binding transcriptional MerR regulator